MKNESETITEAYKKYQHSTQGIDVWEEGAFRAGWNAMQEYADMQVKEAIDKLPGALEIQAHAKVLNEEDFRDYMNEFLGKKLK